MSKLNKHYVTSSDMGVRIAYPAIFEPEENKLSGKREYSARICFMRNNAKAMAFVEQMRKDQKELAKANWGTQWERDYRNALDSKNTRFLRDDPDLDYIYVSLKAREGYPPVVVSPAKRPISKEQAQELGWFLSGDFVNVVFDMFTYEKNARGWSGALGAVQYIAQGEPLGGARRADPNEFEDLSDTGDTSPVDELP